MKHDVADLVVQRVLMSKKESVKFSSVTSQFDLGGEETERITDTLGQQIKAGNKHLILQYVYRGVAQGRYDGLWKII